MKRLAQGFQCFGGEFVLNLGMRPVDDLKVEMLNKSHFWGIFCFTGECWGFLSFIPVTIKWQIADI